MGALAIGHPGLDARGARGARRRLAVALAASALCHAVLTAPAGAPRVLSAGAAPPATLSVRVRIAPDAGAARPAETAPAAVPAPVQGARMGPGHAAAPATRAVPDRAGAAEASAARPPVVDTNWYSAQELDEYPRPVSPLRLDPGLADKAAAEEGRALLWLRINERGDVVEVSAGSRDTPAALVEAARAALFTLRFEPARKDERAVRSRILLSVSRGVPDGAPRPQVTDRRAP